MKRALLLLPVLVSSILLFAQKGKKVYLDKYPDNGVMVSGSLFQPGDTIALRSSSSPFSYVFLGNVVGSREKPIVVINEGGPVQMSAGIAMESCQYVKVTGTGSKDKYGFQMSGSGGPSVAISKKSKNIEVNNVSIINSEYGFWIKNEADCDSTVNKWVMDSISVHDCYFRNMHSQAFYAGSTAPNGERPINCNGATVYPKPGRLGNIRIYNNYIDSTGRSGIQLADASTGMSEIFNNTISNCGRQFNDWQGNGISIGTYTRVYIHHNRIKNTLTNGISSFGCGHIRIENNTIDSSGYLHGKSLAWPWNILVDTRETIPADSTSVTIKDNKLGVNGNKDANIYLGKQFDTWARDNEICNNNINGKPAPVFVTKGIVWKRCGVLVKNEATVSPMIRNIGIAALGVLLIGFLVRMFRQKMRGKNTIKQASAVQVAS